MAFDDFVDLFRMDEHTAYLGGLVGTAHPALDAQVGAPAGTGAFHHRREVSGSKSNQRVIWVQTGDNHFTDFAIGDRFVTAGSDDFQINPFIDDQSLLGV